MIYKRSTSAVAHTMDNKNKATIFQGDCLQLLEKMPDNSVSLVITSPPYCMNKEYEIGNTLEDFISGHQKILPHILRVTKPGGSICWQVGYHVKNAVVTPLDFLVFESFRIIPELKLRNRIVWTFGHGQHCSNRFSGRHETMLWFTKGDDYSFNLDAVRVPQKYPGKRAAKGPRKGDFSGNPNGKNPSDVWDIPNVKANHIEKLDHPCQFPVEIAQRMVRALTHEQDLVLDPFCGVGSAGAAAVIENRRFLGAELDELYAKTCEQRLTQALSGTLRVRPMNTPIREPSPFEAVSQRPAHFLRL